MSMYVCMYFCTVLHGLAPHAIYVLSGTVLYVPYVKGTRTLYCILFRVKRADRAGHVPIFFVASSSIHFVIPEG